MSGFAKWDRAAYIDQVGGDGKLSVVARRCRGWSGGSRRVGVGVRTADRRRTRRPTASSMN
jgi:hypothetical protein